MVSEQESTEMTDEVWAVLSEQHQHLKEQIAEAKEVEHATGEYQLDRTASPEVKTAVSADRLKVLNEELLSVPDGFTDPSEARQAARTAPRGARCQAGGIVWAHAEALAFASLLTEGIPIRLTGQDTERGTFSQRHLVLHDPKTGQEHCAIQHLPGALAPMELHNSPLSEIACLGFEYGYSQEGPETLVLWEAQFGDFVNSAQVIIDQFIVSGLAKWGQTSRLTLLLPHGYEGLGARALLGAARALPAARRRGQHPRRQLHDARPVLPPAAAPGADRQAAAARDHDAEEPAAATGQATSGSRSSPRAASSRCSSEPGIEPSQVTRLVLCSGKIYYDLIGHEARKDSPGVAIGRVELLYPFPQAEILSLVASYPRLREVLWVQEEPRNMGARAFMSPRLLQILPEPLQFGYVGRPERAASGEGYPVAHAQEQNRIVSTALDLDQPVSQYPRKLPGER